MDRQPPRHLKGLGERNKAKRGNKNPFGLSSDFLVGLGAMTMKTMIARRPTVRGDGMDLAFKACVAPEELERVVGVLHRLAASRAKAQRTKFLDTVGAFLEHARDEDVRVAAVGALTRTKMESATARRLMLRALRDQASLVRIEAIESAAEAKARFATPAIRRLLADRDKLVRGYAADALAHLAGVRSQSELRRRLRSERQPWVRARIYGALLFIGDAAAISRLERLAQSADHLTAAIAGRLLGWYTPKQHAAEAAEYLQRVLAAKPPLGVAEVLTDAIVKLRSRAAQTRRLSASRKTSVG